MSGFLQGAFGQTVLLGVLLCQNVSHALLIQISRAVPTHLRYFSSTAVLCGEFAKIIGSVIALLITGTSLAQVAQFCFSKNSWKNSWTLIFPALVYTFQNNLQFVALSNIPATEFQLLSQGKTLTTAMFSVFFLGTRLSRVQWMALMLLVIGVALAQLPQGGGSGATTSTTAGHDGGDGEASSWSLLSNHSYGVLAVVALTVTSGAAGVYQEMVVKKYMDLSIHYLNIQLGVLSVATNTLSILMQDRAQIAEKGFFFGYTGITWAVIAVSSLGGIIVAIVIRYTSNLAKSYAVSFTIFITSLITYVWLPESSNLSLQWLLAAVVVVISVLLYIDPASQVPKEAVALPPAPVSTSSSDAAVELTSVETDSGSGARSRALNGADAGAESAPLLDEAAAKRS